MIPNFRCWSIDRKKMFKIIDILDIDKHSPTFCVCPPGNDEVSDTLYGFEAIIEQSTGLTDKNGVEIFEGDILGTKNSNSSPYDRSDPTKRVVKRHDKDNNLYLFTLGHSLGYPASGYQLSVNTQNRFTVIGNIHE